MVLSPSAAPEAVLREFYVDYAARHRLRVASAASLDQTMIDEIRAFRHDCRQSEGGGGMCHLVTEFVEDRLGWPRVAVAYLAPDARVVCGAHYVNVLLDGSLLDPTADQFGEGHDVRLLRAADEDYRRYRPEWCPDYNPLVDPWCARIAAAFGVVYEGGEDDDLAQRNRELLGEGWWVADKTELTGYWREALAYAQASSDSFYAQYALKALAGLEAAEGSLPSP